MLRKTNRRRRAARPLRPARSWPSIPWSALGLAAGLLAMGAGVYQGGVWMLNQPIETIRLHAPFQRVSAVQLEALVEPHARAGFIGIDLGAARRDLLALPWVERARLRRRFPGTLEVEVYEQRPIARWGERGLLNAAGGLFLPEAGHELPELPRLKGPQGAEAEVTGRYLVVQELLQQRGLSVAAIALDERGSWSFRTSKGLEVRLGAHSIDERIRRFFQALDRSLTQLSGEVDYVDMRYPNGFAVGWKAPEELQAASAAGGPPHG